MKVRKDPHGLYVRTEGYVFRPRDKTRYKFWDSVEAHLVKGTFTAQVGEEVWDSHGTNFYLVYDKDGKYVTTRFKKSTEVFNPDTVGHHG